MRTLKGFSKVLFNSNEKEFCNVVVKVSDGGVFSLEVTSGEVLSLQEATERAFESTKEYFNDNRAEIINMNERFGSKCYDAYTAAKFSHSIDGELHGLDIFLEKDDKVFLRDSYYNCYSQVPEITTKLIPVLKRFTHLVGRILTKVERKRLLKMCNDFLLRDYNKEQKSKTQETLVPSVTQSTSEPLMVDDPNPVPSSSVEEIMDLLGV